MVMFMQLVQRQRGRQHYAAMLNHWEYLMSAGGWRLCPAGAIQLIKRHHLVADLLSEGRRHLDSTIIHSQSAAY